MDNCNSGVRVPLVPQDSKLQMAFARNHPIPSIHSIPNLVEVAVHAEQFFCWYLRVVAMDRVVHDSSSKEGNESG